MRTLTLLAATGLSLLTVACSGDKDASDDSGATDGGDGGSDGADGTSDGDDGGDGGGGCPDEVPEDYRNVWDCTTERCGAPVYYRYAEGSSTASSIEINESWYIFQDESTWCVDTFTISGTFSPIDPATLNCSECEEIWESTWTMSSGNSCGLAWGGLFERDSSETEGPFYGYMMFDTHSPLAGRNPDNAMLVIAATADSRGGPFAPDPNWAEGTATPTTGEDTYPHDYLYVSDSQCTARSTVAGLPGSLDESPTLPETAEKLTPLP